MSRKERIHHQLQSQFNPAFLSVEDESKNHHVPQGAETHFKIIAVSSQFKGLTRVARHRLVNQLLNNELQQGLHALSMFLYTEEEWENNQASVLKSPPCKDGYGA